MMSATLSPQDTWSLDQWLAWQTTLHPHRMEFGLGRVTTVWSRLGAPDLGCPVITVGGTNGKGSCIAYLDAMARAGGFRTGCYTSPHLRDYNERVRIDGERVTDQALCAAFGRVEAARDGTPLTYFEFGTLAALDLFASAALDLVLLEVGLGGRLDAVNLIAADCAVVTSIGHDHQAWLGETLDAIAIEKAGIFRPGRPAVIGQPDAPPGLRAAGERLGARVLQVGHEIGCQPESAAGGWIWDDHHGDRLVLPPPALRGRIQYFNAAAAVTALRCLRERLPVPVGALRAGLGQVRLPGRFQVLPGEVTWILDVAHNPEAAQALAANLGAFPRPGRVHAVFGVLADKDPEGMTMPLLPFVDAWYLTASRDARALPADRLAALLQDVLADAERTVLPTVSQALEAASGAAAPGDCILVFGSFTTVGEALATRVD